MEPGPNSTKSCRIVSVADRNWEVESFGNSFDYMMMSTQSCRRDFEFLLSWNEKKNPDYRSVGKMLIRYRVVRATVLAHESYLHFRLASLPTSSVREKRSRCTSEASTPAEQASQTPNTVLSREGETRRGPGLGLANQSTSVTACATNRLLTPRYHITGAC